MGDVNEAMALLHTLLTQRKEVQDQLERGPRLLKAKKNATEQKQASLDELRTKHRTLRMRADEKSLQLKSNEAKILNLRMKLNQASSNREYDALRMQIDADTMANSVLEDEILDALEQVDTAHIAIKQCEVELAACQAEEARFAKELVGTQEGLEKRLAELTTSLTAAQTAVPENLAPQFRRQVQAHGHESMAAIEGKTCTFCWVAVPPQYLMQVKQNQPLFCKTCGRLLYLKDDADDE